MGNPSRSSAAVYRSHTRCYVGDSIDYLLSEMYSQRGMFLYAAAYNYRPIRFRFSSEKSRIFQPSILCEATVIIVWCERRPIVRLQGYTSLLM